MHVYSRRSQYQALSTEHKGLGMRQAGTVAGFRSESYCMYMYTFMYINTIHLYVHAHIHVNVSAILQVPSPSSLQPHALAHAHTHTHSVVSKQLAVTAGAIATRDLGVTT